MSSPDPFRGLAIDAVDVLNDLIGDLITGTKVLREFNQRFEAQRLTLDQMVGVQKMCLSHLVLAMAKLLEFWEHYHSVVPADIAPDFKLMNRRIRAREIAQFRNSVVGHLWNDRLKRPLKHSEIMASIGAVLNGDIAGSLRWLNDPVTGNNYPDTVLSVVKRLRNVITANFHIEPAEVIDR